MAQTITSVIAELQAILNQHGDIPVLNGDMKEGAGVDLMVGSDGEEGFEALPDGYVHIGAW